MLSSLHYPNLKTYSPVYQEQEGILEALAAARLSFWNSLIVAAAGNTDLLSKSQADVYMSRHGSIADEPDQPAGSLQEADPIPQLHATLQAGTCSTWSKDSAALLSHP
jgi:hypothetical protein